MAITHVQNQSVRDSSVSTAAVTISSTGGNTLIAYISAYITSNTALAITSISDSASNTWQYSTATSSQSPPASGAWDSGDGVYGFTAVAYCINATTVTSVTVHMNNTCVILDAGVTEFSGVPAGAVLDGSASNAPNTAVTTFTTPSITTTATADAIIAIVSTGSALACATSGIYTIIEMGGVTSGELAAWGISSSAGSQACTFTCSSQVIISSAILAIGQATVTGSSTISGTGAATGSGGPPASGTSGLVSALPGPVWLRQFHHPQQYLPVIVPSATGSSAITAGGALAAAGGRGGVPAHFFPAFETLIATGRADLGTDTLVAGLVAAGTFTWGTVPQSYQYVSQFLTGDGQHGPLTEVSTEATGYSRLPLTGVTYSTSGEKNTLTCSNPIWPLVTLSASYAFFYDASVGSGDTSHPILAYWDFGAPQPVSDNSFTLEVSPSGLATWTSS